MYIAARGEEGIMRDEDENTIQIKKRWEEEN